VELDRHFQVQAGELTQMPPKSSHEMVIYYAWCRGSVELIELCSCCPLKCTGGLPGEGLLRTEHRPDFEHLLQVCRYRHLLVQLRRLRQARRLQRHP
jgi:hypothetical protein